MGNPAEQADTQNESGQGTKKPEPTFSDRVSEVVKDMKQDSKGNWTVPDDLPEEIRVAALAEKRYRDTQAAFTRTRQENKALKAEKSVLLEKATKNVQLTLTKEQQAELEDLKFEDPEEWRRKLNKYEQAARLEHEKELEEDVKKVSSSSLEQEELERRKGVLQSFLEQHEGFELDDDVIANDIPPRITKKLENNEITFEDFLDECYTYMNTGKVIQNEKLRKQPNLGKAGGGSSPDENAVTEDVITSYNKETY